MAVGRGWLGLARRWFSGQQQGALDFMRAATPVVVVGDDHSDQGVADAVTFSLPVSGIAVLQAVEADVWLLAWGGAHTDALGRTLQLEIGDLTDGVPPVTTRLLRGNFTSVPGLFFGNGNGVVPPVAGVELVSNNIFGNQQAQLTAFAVPLILEEGTEARMTWATPAVPSEVSLMFRVAL